MNEVALKKNPQETTKLSTMAEYLDKHSQAEIHDAVYKTINSVIDDEVRFLYQTDRSAYRAAIEKRLSATVPPSTTSENALIEGSFTKGSQETSEPKTANSALQTHTTEAPAIAAENSALQVYTKKDSGQSSGIDLMVPLFVTITVIAASALYSIFSKFKSKSSPRQRKNDTTRFADTEQSANTEQSTDPQILQVEQDSAEKLTQSQITKQ